MMESYLWTNLPIQMISCTDTTGKITPIRFRFVDRDGERVTVNVERIIDSDQKPNGLGASFTCAATFFGSEKLFYLYYSGFSGKWSICKIGQ